MTAVLLAVVALILPTHTPGAKNPAVTQATIDKTVCVGGYSSRIRPPSAYTSRLKTEQLRDWRYRDQIPADFEEDHYIPLSLGGSPTSPDNLWPQPWPQALRDDVIERQLWISLCTHEITLRQAQSMIIRWKRVHG